MLDKQALLKTDAGWQFASESDLEDYIGENLQSLLGLQPLARQYAAQGEYCDLLATNHEGQLIILELKNVEDRYVVQQLTRYYENLLSEKPFQERVNYDLPVQLIAIAPTFHKHNFIDRKHSKLAVIFLRFDISQEQQELYITLQDTDSSLQQQAFIPYPAEYVALDSDESGSRVLPRPPKVLQKMLEQKVPTLQKKVLTLREKLLGFSEQMGEECSAATACYGLKKGKTGLVKGKLCAEFQVVSMNKGEFYRPHLYLWLPFPKGKVYLRGNINFTESQFLKIEVHTYDLEQAVQKISVQRNTNARSGSGESYSIEMYLQFYRQLRGKVLPSTTLGSLVDTALEEWSNRLDQKQVFVIFSPHASGYLDEHGGLTADLDTTPKFSTRSKCEQVLAAFERAPYYPYCKAIMWSDRTSSNRLGE